MQTDWLTQHLQTLTLDPSNEDYVRSRGLTTDLLVGLQICTWIPTDYTIPDADFRGRYGPRGEKLDGWLIQPLRDPTGFLLGFDARHPWQKVFIKHRTPLSKYCPIFGGLPFFFPQIADQYPVVLCEGLFDMAALSHVYSGPILSIGTAKLSWNQINFCVRFCGSVYLVMDEDPAGRKGTQENLPRLLRKGVRAYPIAYREGKDPGVIWDNLGEEGLRQEFEPALLPIRTTHHGKLLEGRRIGQ